MNATDIGKYAFGKVVTNSFYRDVNTKYKKTSANFSLMPYSHSSGLELTFAMS